MIEPALDRGVAELPAAIVAQQDIRPAVVGVVVRHRLAEYTFAIAKFARRVATAEKQIEVAVEVVVGGGDRVQVRRRARFAAFGEFSAAVVLHQHPIPTLCERQVLVAVVVEIDKQRGARDLHPIDPSRRRDIAQGAVIVAQEELVWQTSLLADVDIVETVAVRIADRDALQAIDVEPEVAL